MKNPFPINESQLAQLAENYRKIEKGSDPLKLSTVVKLRLTDFEVRWALVAIDPLNWNDAYALRTLDVTASPSLVRVRLGDLLSLSSLTGKRLETDDHLHRQLGTVFQYLESQATSLRTFYADIAARLEMVRENSDEVVEGHSESDPQEGNALSEKESGRGLARGSQEPRQPRKQPANVTLKLVSAAPTPDPEAAANRRARKTKPRRTPKTARGRKDARPGE